MTARSKGWYRLAPIALIVGGLTLAIGLGLHRHLSIEALAHHHGQLAAAVSQHRVLAALAFAGLYALATLLLLPGAGILTVAGGLFFGWLLGGALAVLGATIGAALVFLAARSAFGDVLKRRAGGSIARFAKGFREDAFAYLLILRLTPIIPFVALNIVPAFFDIPLRTFVAATFIGIIPGAFVYAFLGSGLGATLAAARDGTGIALSDIANPQTTIALGGLAVLSALGFLVRRRSRRLAAPVADLPAGQQPS